MKTIIVGGGPAGMMAALRASAFGETVLLEKNEKLGKKLYITGKGRCNVTNDCSAAELLENVPRNPKFLFSAVNRFTPGQLKEMLERLGVPLKTERGGRVFPQSDKSSDIIRALARGLEAAGAEIRTGTEVTGLLTGDGEVTGVITDKGRISADAVIMATGGCSYPQTGSDGQGLALVKRAGHGITQLRPALVPLNTSDSYVPQLQGLTLKNVSLNAQKGKKLLFSRQGELLCTHFGLSGPLTLTMSSVLAPEELAGLDIYIDLKPALSPEQLDNRLIRDFLGCGGRKLKNMLSGLAPSSLQPVLIGLSGANGDKRADQLSRKERESLVSVLKHFPVHAVSYRGFNEAIITRGGVDVRQVNSSTMESRLIKRLFLAGEMLDVDAFTGGYNLQIAFSSGFLAGESVGRYAFGISEN